jgi:hypothetical protein
MPGIITESGLSSLIKKSIPAYAGIVLFILWRLTGVMRQSIYFADE